MDTQQHAPLHPMIKVAAGSVILASAVAIAIMTGVFAGATPEQKAAAEAAEVQAKAETEKAAAVAACKRCGTVVSVDTIVEKGKGTGIGAVGGAVVGGVAGHQVGGGRGKDVATAVGVIGGAFAGNEAEKAIRKTKHYEVSVRMENGSRQTFNYQNPPSFAAGDEVKVESGKLVHQ